MYTHPAQILFAFSLTISLLFTISANNWFTAWIGLELNLLAFIPLMLKKKNKYSSEATLKYFLIQALASSVIIFTITMNFKELNFFLLSISLLLKSGAAPLHQWMPSLVEGLSWPTLFMLLTLQKINPLILLASIKKYDSIFLLFFLFILSSATIGCLGGLNQTSLMKMMTFSSISHMSWMLSAMLMNNWCWLNYFLIYSLILASIIFSLNKLQMFNLPSLMLTPQNTLSIPFTISFLSLAGLPPLTGFLPKILVTKSIMFTNSTTLLIFLFTSTVITLFFYARLFINFLLLSTMSINFFDTKHHSFISLLWINMSGLVILPLLFFL